MCFRKARISYPPACTTVIQGLFAPTVPFPSSEPPRAPVPVPVLTRFLELPSLPMQVESALPVIDVGPPAERGHVSCKLKQVQSESERCAQIGRDNCALVLRLAHIMRTSRVDNGWRQPPPT